MISIRSFRAAVSACALVVLGCFFAWSNIAAMPLPDPLFGPAPEVYFCPQVATPPVIDGDLGDATWALAPWSADFVDIEGARKPLPTWRTNLKMAWDADCLYVAAYLEEPHVWGKLTERDAVIYHDNDFEVFIDPDGDNHLYYELEINALGTEWDLLLVRPYRDGAPAVNAWDIQGLKTAVKIDGTLNDPSDVDSGWSVEIAVPWDVLSQCAGRPAPPQAGHVWRMNFSRVQWQTGIVDGDYVKKTDPETGRALPENNWVWSPQGLIAMHYPERWGEVMFLAPGQDAFARQPTFAMNTEHLAHEASRRLMTVYYAQKNFFEKHGRFTDSLEELAALEIADPLRHWAGVRLECAGGARFSATLAIEHTILTVDETGRLGRAKAGE